MKITYAEYNGSELTNKKEYTGHLNKQKSSYLLVADNTLETLVLPVDKVNKITFNPETTSIFVLAENYNEVDLLQRFKEHTVLLKPTIIKLEVGIGELVKKTKLPVFNFSNDSVLLVNKETISKSKLGTIHQEGESAVLYLFEKDFCESEVINLINFYKGVIKC